MNRLLAMPFSIATSVIAAANVSSTKMLIADVLVLISAPLCLS
jgi:hypothetical protein